MVLKGFPLALLLKAADKACDEQVFFGSLRSLAQSRPFNHSSLSFPIIVGFRVTTVDAQVFVDCASLSIPMPRPEGPPRQLEQCPEGRARVKTGMVCLTVPEKG